jgi:hypothetical protein
MQSIADQIRSALTTQVVHTVDRVIDALDDAPEAMRSGLVTAIPAVLSDVVVTASMPGGGEWVRTIIAEGCYGAGTLEEVLGALEGGTVPDWLMTAGRHLLTGLFGSRQDDVADAVGKSTGLSRGLARDVMRVAAPIAFGVLAADVMRRDLDGPGIVRLVAAQRASIEKATPPAVAAAISSGWRPAHSRTPRRPTGSPP